MPDEYNLVKSRGVLDGFINAPSDNRQTAYDNLTAAFQKLGVFKKKGRTLQRYKYIIACARLALDQGVDKKIVRNLIYLSLFVMDNSK